MEIKKIGETFNVNVKDYKGSPYNWLVSLGAEIIEVERYSQALRGNYNTNIYKLDDMLFKMENRWHDLNNDIFYQFVEVEIIN